MPRQLIVLVVLWAALFVASLVHKEWVGVVFHALMVLGLLRGNDLIRKIMIGLSALGIVFGAFALVVALVAVFTQGGGIASGEHAAFAGGMMLLVAIALFLVPGYTIHVLRRPHVQKWMFARSARLPLDEV